MAKSKYKRKREQARLREQTLANAPRKQNETSIHPRQNAENKSHNPPKDVSLPPEIDAPPAPSNPTKTANSSHQSPQWWNVRLERARSILEIIAIPFAIGYAVVTYCQWRDTGNSFIKQQQPWVSIVQPTTNVMSSEQGNFVVRGNFGVRNFGQSPAFRVYPMFGVVGSFPELEKEMKTVCEAAKADFEKGLPLNNGSGDTAVAGTTIFPGQQIQSGFVAGFTLMGTVPESPYIAGCLYYKDQWGRIRHTQVCLSGAVTNKPQNLSFCPAYSEAD